MSNPIIVSEDELVWNVKCAGGCDRVISQSKRVGKYKDITNPSAGIIWRDAEVHIGYCSTCGLNRRLAKKGA
jgi:hypothetical protein